MESLQHPVGRRVVLIGAVEADEEAAVARDELDRVVVCQSRARELSPRTRGPRRGSQIVPYLSKLSKAFLHEEKDCMLTTGVSFDCTAKSYWSSTPSSSRISLAAAGVYYSRDEASQDCL